MQNNSLQEQHSGREKRDPESARRYQYCSSGSAICSNTDKCTPCGVAVLGKQWLASAQDGAISGVPSFVSSVEILYTRISTTKAGSLRSDRDKELDRVCQTTRDQG